MSKILITELELMQDLDSETAASCTGGNSRRSTFFGGLVDWSPTSSNSDNVIAPPQPVFTSEPFLIEDPDSFFNQG